MDDIVSTGTLFVSSSTDRSTEEMPGRTNNVAGTCTWHKNAPDHIEKQRETHRNTGNWSEAQREPDKDLIFCTLAKSGDHS